MNKRKGIIYLTIGVVALLILVAGTAYAYFQIQSDDGKSAILNTTTGTTDNLTFSVSDIDVSKDKKEYVIDEETTENIVINASQDNFGQNDKTIGDGVIGKATLLANSTNNTATMNYNVYFAINENNFKYTTEEKKPELILKVYDPEGTEIKKIEGLNYHEKDETNNKDISGFDITERKGAFAIKHGQTIETTSGKKEEEWKVEVYLINLATDQKENAGKTLTGVVKITTTEEDTYTLAHINTIIPETTSSSIKATVELDKNSTNEVTKYYFAIEEKGIAQTVLLSEKTKGEIEDWEEETENHHLFEGLEDNTNYIIYSYVVDSEGFESNIYETEIIATDIELPQITSAEVTSKTYNSITVEVKEKTDGSLPITKYEYEISGEGIETPKIEEDSNMTHTFTGLNELTEYTINIRAVDGKENKSTNYNINSSTRESYYHETCNDDSGACKIAKLSVNNNSIIFHDGLSDYTDMKNSDLEAEDYSYRYTGGNDIVNNYVCFGANECNETTNYDNLYRIIGIFKNEDTNNYEMKIIKADYAIEEELGGKGVGAYYNIYPWVTGSNYKGLKENIYSVAISYKWPKSEKFSNTKLSTVNLNDYYLNTYLGNEEHNFKSNPNTWQKMITNHKYQVVSTNVDIMIHSNAKQAFNNEIKEKNISEAENFNVGLMYTSDFYYAASSKYWNLQGVDANGSYSDNSSIWTGNDYSLSANNNWLFMGLYEWTMTLSENGCNGANCSILVRNCGQVTNSGADVNAVRPSFYLKADVKIIDGYGTSTNPYIISQ